MTVKELIEQLQQYDQDRDVVMPVHSAGVIVKPVVHTLEVEEKNTVLLL